MEYFVADHRDDGEPTFLRYRKDQVRLPSGALAYREYIEHPGAVATMAITDDGYIVLEKQYRHPCRAIFIEIPAGKLNEHEDPSLAAARELHEETGYTAKHWEKLGDIPLCIGYSNERLHYYVATQLTLGERSLDDGEHLDVLLLPIAEALAMSTDGRITDAKTIVGLHLLQAYLIKHSLERPTV
jgi:ADP-ribose pyrophosphatase